LAYLHGESIQEIIASDVDENAVELAKRNLGLLDMAGMDKRIVEIKTMLEQFGKDSHKDALKSTNVLKKKLSLLSKKHLLKTRVFQANTLAKDEILGNIKPESVDIIFTDVPYGQHSNWLDSDEISNPLWSTLDALLGVLSQSSIVAIVSDKGQKALHESYQRIERFQVGKRRILILKPL
jgi:16S rRNA G966 N2-methylase RsmD